MTETTRNLIDDFQMRQDLRLLPSIIIGMQEEDKVSEIIEFGNCFKKLRNIAAHEPDNLISQVQLFIDTGCQKLLLVTKDNIIITVDMVQFTAWMMNMYQLVNEFYYIIFLISFIKLLYPKAIKRMENSDSISQFIFHQIPLRGYLCWIKYMYYELGITYPIASADPYIIKIYKEDQKLFWRIAIPDMMQLVIFLVSNRVSLEDRKSVV